MTLSSYEEQFVIDGQAYTYRLRRSRRARHILLTVDDRGRIELVVPWRVSFRTARQFLREKRVWLVQQTARQQPPAWRVADGATLPFLDGYIRLRIEVEPERQRSRKRIANEELIVSVSEAAQARPAIERWYRQRAAAYFPGCVAAAAARLRVRPGRVAVSGASTQWGSCIPSTGRISLNWRLLLAPRTVVDYVAAHEVAHLLQRRHTPRFWAAVAYIMPEYVPARRWLQRHGRHLYF